MIQWFKRLFGFAEVVLTLDEKHRKASDLGETAVALFDRAVQQLEAASGNLKAIADEAWELAEKYGQQANAASAEAAKNAARADKIRALLGE